MACLQIVGKRLAIHWTGHVPQLGQKLAHLLPAIGVGPADIDIVTGNLELIVPAQLHDYLLRQTWREVNRKNWRRLEQSRQQRKYT